MRKLILAFALAVTARAARAQELDRSKRPAVPPAAPFHFPAVHAHTLPNGLRVLVVEDHSIPLVAARVILPDATIDPKGKEGLDSLTIGALREGTTTRNGEQIADAFADIGTPVTPTRFTVTTDGAPAALALVADMLMHPSLDSAGVERRRAMQAASARASTLSSSIPARHLFHALIYGAEDSWVRSLSPSDAAVNKLTRADVEEQYRRYFGPRTTTIVLAGDLTDRGAMALVTHAFGSWSSAASLPAAAKPTASTHVTTLFLNDAPTSTDVSVLVGNAAPPRSTPDFYAAEVAATAAHLRMQQVLRTQHSFMYAGSSGMIWPAAPRQAEFVGSTRFPIAKTDSAIIAWVGLLRDLHGANPATAQEVDAARRYILANLTSRTEGADMIADRVADLVRDDLPLDYYDRYFAGIAHVTTEQANAAAVKFIDTDHLTIAITGPRAKIEAALRAANIGPVVLVDANGSPIK